MLIWGNIKHWAQGHWIPLMFPVLLLVAFGTLTACKISGSSVGTYNVYLNGNSYKDNKLLFGIPRGVRGDEWQVLTPNVVSQAKNNFLPTNNDIGNGEDMSVILDAPYKDWSVILQPWDLGYFFLSLETAFALQWWFMLFALGVVVYLLALRLMPRSYVFASLAALFVMASPMIQWWYRAYLIMTIASALAALLIAMKLSESNVTKWPRLGLSVLLGYVLAVFVFIQYPPYQAMAALPVSLFYIGFLGWRGLFTKDERRELLRIIMSVGIGVCIMLITVGVYYIQHHKVVNAVLSSKYPASRVFPSGQGTFATVMHWFANPFQAELQGATTAAIHYWQNQSEASLFIGFAGLLVVPASYTCWVYLKKKHQIRWDLLLPIIGILLIYIYIFVPGLTDIYKLLYFTSIPANRFALGLGLLEFLLLLLLAKEYSIKKLEAKVVWLCVALALILFIIAGLYTIHTYPGYVHGGIVVVFGISIWMVVALWLLLKGKRTLALLLLVVLSLLSTFKVNPLYQGLSPLTDTPLAVTIQSIVKHDPNARWVDTDSTLEMYPQANGAKSVTGYYSYAQDSLWQQVDPDTDGSYVYDRTAHVEAQISNTNDLTLTSDNHFTFNINPCSALPKTLHVSYVLTTQRQQNTCLALLNQFNFQVKNVYIYKIVPAPKPKLVAARAIISKH